MTTSSLLQSRPATAPSYQREIDHWEAEAKKAERIELAIFAKAVAFGLSIPRDGNWHFAAAVSEKGEG